MIKRSLKCNISKTNRTICLATHSNYTSPNHTSQIYSTISYENENYDGGEYIVLFHLCNIPNPGILACSVRKPALKWPTTECTFKEEFVGNMLHYCHVAVSF